MRNKPLTAFCKCWPSPSLPSTHKFEQLACSKPQQKEKKKRRGGETSSSLFLQVALKCIWCTLVAALVILYVMNAKGETVITDAVFEIIHMKTNEHMNLFQFIQFDFSWTQPLEKFRSHPSQSICLPYKNHRAFWLHEVLISSALMFSLMVRQLLNFTQRHISFSSGNLSTFICCVTLHNPHTHACLPSPIHITGLIIPNYLWRLFTIRWIALKGTKSAVYYFLLLYYDEFFFGVWFKRDKMAWVSVSRSTENK